MIKKYSTTKYFILILSLCRLLIANDTLLIIEEGGFRKGSQFITIFFKDSLCINHKYHIDDDSFCYCEKMSLINKMRFNKIQGTINQISSFNYKADGIYDGGYISIKKDSIIIECVNCLIDLNKKRQKIIGSPDKTKKNKLLKIRKIWNLLSKINVNSTLISKNNYCKKPVSEDEYWCTEE